jgi:hypothetical protein
MYGIHFDHHTLSIARDGELLASEPLAVETISSEPRAGAGRRWPLRVAGGRVSLNHWRELGSNETASRNVAREMLVHLHALGVSERIDAVVAVPADLDPGALAALRGALHAAGVDARDFVDAAALSAAAVAERGHYVLLEAGWRSATATRVAGGPECAIEEAFVSERANLLDVYDRLADGGGGGHGQEHALRSSAEPRTRTTAVRQPAAGGGARRDRRARRSRARGRRLRIRDRSGCAAVRRCGAVFLS